MIKYGHFGLVLGALIALPIFASASDALPVESPFLYNFNQDGVLVNSPRMDTSTSPYFWLSQGNELSIIDGLGTLNGDSILTTRSTWNNLSEEVSFMINSTLTDSPTIDAYSGLFFLSRFKDGNNFYYAGIRMDGQAVIKKKIGSYFYTIATSQVFNTNTAYDKTLNPNLIPSGSWMRLKSETKNIGSGEIAITLWIDKDNSGEWTQILTATDVAGRYGKSPVINGGGYAGIRSDSMNISLEDYKLTEI